MYHTKLDKLITLYNILFNRQTCFTTSNNIILQLGNLLLFSYTKFNCASVHQCDHFHVTNAMQSASVQMEILIRCLFSVVGGLEWAVCIQCARPQHYALWSTQCRSYRTFPVPLLYSGVRWPGTFVRTSASRRCITGTADVHGIRRGAKGYTWSTFVALWMWSFHGTVCGVLLRVRESSHHRSRGGC